MKSINLKAIRLDGGTQSRASLNEAVVAEYVECLVELPPVVLFFDGSDHWLADGFHRYHAYLRAGKASIFAEVKTGTCRDAKLYSVGANGLHGLRPTNADKRSAVLMLLDDPEWSSWSQERIAKQCFVSPGFVSRLVAERRASLHGEEIKPAVRTVERAGKTFRQDTARIGKTAPKPASTQKAPPEMVPDDLAAELAETQSAVSILSDENDRLNDRLAVEAMDATDEEKLKAAATIAELRAELKTANAELKAVRAVRDDYMRENGELKKTVASLQRKLKKLEEPA